MSRPGKVKEGHPTDFPTLSIDGKDSEAMQEVLGDECAESGFETRAAAPRHWVCQVRMRILLEDPA